MAGAPGEESFSDEPPVSVDATETAAAGDEGHAAGKGPTPAQRAEDESGASSVTVIPGSGATSDRDRAGSAQPSPVRVAGDRRLVLGRAIALSRPVVALVALIIAIAKPEWALPALIVAGAPVVFRTILGALRGQWAADVVASMAIAGAALLNEPIAGLVVVLMQTGGEALERWAEGRASAAVRALEEAAPNVAHVVEGEVVRDVPSDDVRVNDLMLIRPGELVPCDSTIVKGSAHVDTSRITGEPIAQRVGPGDTLQSGVLNGESPLLVRATAPASESQYARIVELVRTAQASKAPIQRMADRYAVWFTPLTIAVCIVTWLASRDPVRVLAVLVVATPCPLILAAPVAIIGGINRLARRQVIVRNGTALEQLASVNAAVFDKTGTLTLGRPHVAAVHAANGFSREEVLALGAAVERGSGHLLAESFVEHALEAGIEIPRASEIRDTAGRGVEGSVNGRRVRVGSRKFLADTLGGDALDVVDSIAGAGQLNAVVSVDDELAGVVIYADAARSHAAEAISGLRDLGLDRMMVLSGDRMAAVTPIAESVGVSEARGDLLPEEKVKAVHELLAGGYRVLMVGDGTNDAPALSAATVGVAVGSGSGGIATESADVVLLGDDLRRLPESVAVARRTLRITRESIWAGLAMSGTAMVFAAFGYIQPTIGALLQEAIDLAVIANALRASRDVG